MHKIKFYFSLYSLVVSEKEKEKKLGGPFMEKQCTIDTIFKRKATHDAEVQVSETLILLQVHT